MYALPGSLAPALSVVGTPRLNPRWVARGLVLVVLGDLWITPTGSRAMTPVNAPGRTTGPQGKTTGYGTTDAGNTTARMTGFRLDAPPKGLRSYFGTCRVRSLGGGSLGRVFQDVSGTGVNARAGQHAIWVATSNGTNNVALQVADASLIQNTYHANASYGFLDATKWQSYGFSCRFPSGGTPSFSHVSPYVNGIGTTFVTGSLSAGPYAAHGVGHTDVVFGNRPSDGLRNWDGQLGIFAAFDADLTAAEQASLHSNPNQLLEYLPRVLWASGASAPITVFRPVGDISTAGWTVVGAATVAGAIGEVITSDAEYATSPDLLTPATVSMNGSMAPGTYTCRVRLRKLGGAAQARVRYLDDTNTDVGGTDWQALTDTETTYELPVTLTGTATRKRLELL